MINFTPETLAKCSLCIETRLHYIVKFDEKQDGVYFAHNVLYLLEIFCYLEGKYEENFIVRTKNNVGRFIFYPIVVLQR